MRNKEILGSGPMGQVLVISDHPWDKDIEKQKPFSMPHGEVLKGYLSSNGLDNKVRFEYIIPNAVDDISEYFVDGKSILNQILLAHKRNLINRIKNIKPKVILILGETAFNILFEGSLKFEGVHTYVLNRYELGTCPVIAAYHPAYLNADYKRGIWLQVAIQKVVRILSGEKEPEQKLTFDNDYDKALRYLQEAQTASEVCIDIETIKGKYQLTAIGFSIPGGNALAISPVNLRTREERLQNQFVSKEVSYNRWMKCLFYIRDILKNPNITKVGQNFLSFDALVLWKIYGFQLRGPLYDTMEMCRWQYPDIDSNLADIKRLTGLSNPWKNGQWAKRGAELLAYCAKDVAETHHISKVLKEDMVARNNWEPFEKYFIPLYERAFAMYTKGFNFNQAGKKEGYSKINEVIEPIVSELIELTKGKVPPKISKKKVRSPEKDIPYSIPGLNIPENPHKLKTAEREILLVGTGAVTPKVAKNLYFPKPKDIEKYGLKENTLYKKTWREEQEAKPQKFNPGSAPQRLYVAEELGISIPTGKKKSKKGVKFGKKFDKKTLNKLVIQDKLTTPEQKKYVGLLLQLSPLIKLKTSYYGTDLEPDGRWRSCGPICGTETNRMRQKGMPDGSCGNMQQIPRASVELPSGETLKFKSLFLPDKGKVMMQFDQDAAEGIIVAYLSGCRNMINNINTGTDLHLFTLSKIYGEDISTLTKKDPRRQMIKAITHGYNYLEGAKTVADTLIDGGRLTTKEEAQEMLDLLNGIYPEINEWHEAVRYLLMYNKILENPFGRKRIFMGHISDNSKDPLSEATLRKAVAHSPQSTIPTISNIMWLKACQFFDQNPKFGGNVLNQCHDSLLIQANEECREEFCAWFLKEASNIRFNITEVATGKIHKDIVVPWSGEWGYSWGTLENKI